MLTEAQRRAKAKYQSEKVKQIQVKFYPSDSELIQWMEENNYKGSWVKDLIKREFEKEKNNG